MSDAPIPFIAYFFITVTAGTLAYATYTDVGDNQGTVTEKEDEDSKEDNQELSNTDEEETIKNESEETTNIETEEQNQPPMEQQGVMPNMLQGPPVVEAQPIQSNNMQPQNESIQSLSNPFQKEQVKGGKSKKYKRNKKNKSKKIKNNLAFEGNDINIKKMRQLLQKYKKQMNIRMKN